MKKYTFKNIITLVVALFVMATIFFIHTNNGSIYKDITADNPLYCHDIKELEKQAELGSLSALSELGFCYETGQGVDINYEKSFILYSKSAEKGYGIAQFNIGNAYRHGRGVTRNYQKALEWYQKAAEQGVIKSQVVLGNMYINGQGVPMDSEKAIEWYLKATKMNDTAAMNNLGNVYADGLGVPIDNQQAEFWYNKAVTLGSMSAKNSLAVFYGRGLGRYHDDRDKVLSLVESSACQGYVQAQINLGSFYTDNDGESPVNYKKSYAWYYAAYVNGSLDSKIELNLLAKEMSNEELVNAKKIATEYSQKYRSSPIEDDTFKSQTECRYP